ncbi:MAG TPA: hemolysin family protein [Pyrinomonadaceae bacterium]|jgi:CBS domain containing-hemolysin-like protein|nr:hemolysin family protein [Pyrinomonadaceae bacterium]
MDDPSSNLLFFLAADPEIAVAPESWFSIAFKLISVLVLVAINGFFVAAEFAYVGVRRSRIEALASEGSKPAQRLLKLLNNLNAYLSASQLGITLASLGLGWLGEPAVAALIESPLTRAGVSQSLIHIISFIIAFALITSLHIVLGEQAPKLVGLQLAERVAMATALPMQIFYTIFKLPIHALDWASAKTVNLFGMEADGEHASIYTEEELRGLIEMSHKSGHVNQEERQLINRVFEFSETTVREAMIPRTQMAAISMNSTLTEIATSFTEHGYSRLPVYRESLDDVAGFVHSKDVLPYLLTPETFAWEKVLQAPLYIVDTARLEDVLRQMQKAKIHFGFVVDEHGGVEGIITLEDLLEEIVGDISDEHDEEVNEQIVENADGSFILDGGLAVRDLNKRLDLHVPESDAYTTIAGFLMSEAGQVLDAGESVPFNGHIFRIEKVDKRRIVQVRMEKALDAVSAEEATA